MGTSLIGFEIEQLQIRQGTDEEDRHGADVFLNGLGVAYRKRHISIDTYGQISIRKLENFRAEYEKLLADEYYAPIYFFEFDDAFVVCLTSDIKAYLESGQAFYVPNKDRVSGAYYIPIRAIPHLQINKADMVYRIPVDSTE